METEKVEEEPAKEAVEATLTDKNESVEVPTEDVKDAVEAVEVAEPEAKVDEVEVKAEITEPEAEVKAVDIAEPASEDALETQEEADKENTTTSTQATAATEAEVKAPVTDRFMLLHHLFKFVRTTEAPLNAVLAGYFRQMVILLINKKSKEILPFLFLSGPGEDIFEHLLFHVYQRSVADVLGKLMSVNDH